MPKLSQNCSGSWKQWILVGDNTSTCDLYQFILGFCWHASFWKELCNGSSLGDVLGILENLGNLRAVYSDLFPPVGHPLKVVKSKGILPKIAETFRLRIYNKLPRKNPPDFVCLAIIQSEKSGISWKLQQYKSTPDQHVLKSTVGRDVQNPNKKSMINRKTYQPTSLLFFLSTTSLLNQKITP